MDWEIGGCDVFPKAPKNIGLVVEWLMLPIKNEPIFNIYQNKSKNLIYSRLVLICIVFNSNRNLVAHF